MRVLSLNRKYEEAEKILNSIHILPFEGERGGRVLYREIKMMLATQALAKGNTKVAAKKVSEAHEWPHRLGVGKPYDDQIDTRLEDWINAMIAVKTKDTTNKELYLKRVAQSGQRLNEPSGILQCVAWSLLGEQQIADALFNEWSSLQKNKTIREWGSSFYQNNQHKEYPFDLNEMTQLTGFISGGRDARLF